MTDEIIGDIRWRRTSPIRLNYLQIGNDGSEMRDRMFIDRYSKWNELFPLPAWWRRSKDEVDVDNAADGGGYEVTETIDEGN